MPIGTIIGFLIGAHILGLIFTLNPQGSFYDKVIGKVTLILAFPALLGTFIEMGLT